MLIPAPVVVIDAGRARLLRDLLIPEIQRRLNSGRSLSEGARQVFEELDSLVKLGDPSRRSDARTDRRSEAYRGPKVDGVPTSTAAQHLNVSPRAVIARLHRETLRGSQQPDGTWLVDADHLAALTGRSI